jgi:hypothetical protein
MLALSILGFVNFVYPLISILYPNVKLDLKICQYYFVLASYFCLFLILWFEKDKLEDWNREVFHLCSNSYGFCSYKARCSQRRNLQDTYLDYCFLQ